MFHISDKGDQLRDQRFTLEDTITECLSHHRLGLSGDYLLDVAACHAAHVAERYYTLERGEDGLKLPWNADTVWCNPPWSKLRPWVVKAWDEYKLHSFEELHMLLPVRCEQPFWQTLIEPYRDQPNSPLRVHFLPRRQRFGDPDDPKAEKLDAKGKPKGSPPFICALLVWRQT